MALVKYNNNSISSITTAGQLTSGSLVPISEQTASSSASIEFTTGIDSTYPIYKFEFINIHPSNNATSLRMNFSTDGGSNYGVTKTTTSFEAYHNEPDTDVELRYDTAYDQAQSTADVGLAEEIQSASTDGSTSGYLYVFNPSSSTYVKHFMSTFQSMRWDSYSWNYYKAGYCNTTSSINAIIFRMNVGNIDAGTIKLYGIKDS